MQFDPQRAFPYPVLRPEVDDYTDGDFQATIDFRPSDDGLKLDLEVEFAISVPEIVEVVDAGEANYACVVSCRDTYFREIILTKSAVDSRVFSAGMLRGEIRVFPFVVAVRNITGFRCSLINQEFGKGPFQFKEGSVLAVERPQVCFIDRDVFKPISSIFSLASSHSLTGLDWRIDLSGSKVQILLSAQMKEKIDIFRGGSAANRAVLLNSIYFATVMHCIRRLRDGDDFADCRWADVFRQQCSINDIDLNTCQDYEAAQKLLKTPLKLLDTYFFEGREE